MSKHRQIQGRIRGHILTGLGVLSAVAGIVMLLVSPSTQGIMALFGVGFLVCCLGLMQYRSKDY